MVSLARGVKSYSVKLRETEVAGEEAELVEELVEGCQDAAAKMALSETLGFLP